MFKIMNLKSYIEFVDFPHSPD